MQSRLQHWLDRMLAMHPKSIALGLERIAPVYARLNIKPTCPVFLVSGTNGKGSVCAMLDAILRAEGYRVGLYTSPHLVRYNERVRINGQTVSDDALVEAFEKVEAARGDTPLTFFEFGTLGAFVNFAQQDLDALVLEVGLGGRLDATNLVDADCAVLTSVGIDHTDFLGPTREDIVREKLGIARAQKALVFGEVNPPANAAALIESSGARTLRRGQDYRAEVVDAAQWQYHGPDGNTMSLPYPALRGKFQIHNAASTLAALHTQRPRIPVRAGSIRTGLLTVEWPGRFQVLPGRPTIVLDAAHNPHAALVFAEALGDMGFHPETFAAFGMLNDKDVAGVIDALKHRITKWHAISTHGPRGQSAEKLKEKLCAAGVKDKDVLTFENAEAAFVAAQQNAAETDRILVFGSFHILGEIAPVIERQRRARA